MDNTVEIIKEARKAGMQVALMMFGALIIVSILFGFFIYESCQMGVHSIEAEQTTDTGNNTITQEVK